ncbi:hypothetical protein BofuT4_uP146480.1 [Botrytis cinerea T4]|uniref:Uncharacterized protein n=1 Tax=Botryotinia fuckeliana (strain T4) TaxID=999810 RepID=G2YXY1_BOTF4|nr:hypothetical protein BofuT4_uP146480.1 [Botrytis cinerea T4]
MILNLFILSIYIFQQALASSSSEAHPQEKNNPRAKPTQQLKPPSPSFHTFPTALQITHTHTHPKRSRNPKAQNPSPKFLPRTNSPSAHT